MTSPHLIVADENIPKVREWFAPLGTVVTRSGRDLAAADVRAADILLVRSVTSVGPDLLQDSHVGFVGTATIGTDHLDLDYLARAGITVASAPASNAQSVVDYVLSVLAAMDGVVERLLVGGTVGVVGLGNVGARLLRRLRALGIDAIGCDPFVIAEDLPQQSLAEVLTRDVVCLHTPLTRTGEYPTFHLLNEKNLATLKPDAVLLNAGRGAVIDNRALLRLLEQRHDLRVVLDVWETEPAIDITLLQKVALGTPHIAGYSLDGKLAGTRMLLQACCEFLGEELPITSATDEPLRLQLSNGKAVNTLREALLAVYDPRRDDAALRNFSDDAGISAHFDRLRKNYPVRREIASCVIENWETLDHTAQKLLRAAGFSGRA